jgi:hypothetical protein
MVTQKGSKPCTVSSVLKLKNHLLLAYYFASTKELEAKVIWVQQTFIQVTYLENSNKTKYWSLFMDCKHDSRINKSNNVLSNSIVKNDFSTKDNAKISNEKKASIWLRWELVGNVVIDLQLFVCCICYCICCSTEVYHWLILWHSTYARNVSRAVRQSNSNWKVHN